MQVPSHLHHMLFELVKNSLRAVQERFEDAVVDPPPIRVVVADGLEDVTIKVAPRAHTGAAPCCCLLLIQNVQVCCGQAQSPSLG